MRLPEECTACNREAKDFYDVFKGRKMNWLHLTQPHRDDVYKDFEKMRHITVLLCEPCAKKVCELAEQFEEADQ